MWTQLVDGVTESIGPEGLWPCQWISHLWIIWYPYLRSMSYRVQLVPSLFLLQLCFLAIVRQWFCSRTTADYSHGVVSPQSKVTQHWNLEAKEIFFLWMGLCDCHSNKGLNDTTVENTVSWLWAPSCNNLGLITNFSGIGFVELIIVLALSKCLKVKCINRC